MVTWETARYDERGASMLEYALLAALLALVALAAIARAGGWANYEFCLIGQTIAFGWDQAQIGCAPLPPI